MLHMRDARRGSTRLPGYTPRFGPGRLQKRLMANSERGSRHRRFDSLRDLAPRRSRHPVVDEHDDADTGNDRAEAECCADTQYLER